MKYLKWAFKNNIGHRDDQKIELGKVIICDTWNPNSSDWDERGGFNFTNEECALRWISRGDTLYEVEIPEDEEVLKVKNDKTPGGIFVTNKIILKNPITISDELVRDFYKKSKLPLETYFECIGILATRGYYDISLMIIKDKVNMNNIDLAIDKFNRELKPNREIDYDCYNRVKSILEEIKSSIDINLFIDKEPYIKQITKDNVINLTGQSGSGKTTYAKEHFNSDEYLVVDTDDIFSDNRFNNSVGINKELGEYFRNKYEKIPNCGDNFDLIYEDILNYCSKYNKTIVIDSAQFHCIKDLTLLKGELIIIRTCIDNCYNRTIERYKTNNKNYSQEELEKYKDRKKAIYTWYKSTNEFIEKIDKI
ncbi:MAG: hypothetical protein IJG97_06690 [Bacilli bacterium]|nr:hypothetical protein [Bacilli bacterium]